MIVVSRRDGSEPQKKIDCTKMETDQVIQIVQKLILKTDLSKYDILEVGEARVGA